LLLSTRQHCVGEPDYQDLCRSLRSVVRSFRFAERNNKTFAPPSTVHIGARGFEPPTSWSQTTRSTKLSYAPNRVNYYHDSGGCASPTFDRIRCSNPNSAPAAFPRQRPIRLGGSRNPLPGHARFAQPQNILPRGAKNKGRLRWHQDASQTIQSV
jgi:hypothetical protein